MLNGYCPITLRKKNSTNKKPPSRSQSAPRRSYSSLAVRNLNSSSIRSQKVDEIKKEMEYERKNPDKSINKNLKPAIRHRRDAQLWDAEWCINIQSNKKTFTEKDESRLNKDQSKAIVKSREIPRNNRYSEATDQSAINRIRPPSRAQSVIGFRSKAKNMDEFFDRQNRSAKKRETTAKQLKKVEREQRNKSYMNDESKKILINSQSSSDLLAPRKIKKHDDYSFHPDMLLTSSHSTKDSSCKYEESKKIFNEMRVLEAQMEEEAKEIAECTFTPDLSLSKSSIQRAKHNKEQIIQQNENRKKKVTQNIKNKEKEDNRKISYVKDVPKRTRYINELLSGLRTTPCY